MVVRLAVLVLTSCVVLTSARAQTPSEAARAEVTSNEVASDGVASDGVASNRGRVASDDALRLRLREVRLAHRVERRREGLWLLGWGLASAVGGTIVALARREDQAWLAAGVTTASFGAIDAVLALGLLDLGGARRRMILDDRSGVRTLPPDVREAELVGQLRSGQGFALNAGLDVFYMAAGALLFVLGRARNERAGWEEGAGLAMIGQGAFLFVFDLVAWARSNRRAEALRALR
ncbi:MAG: hypothetical protein KF901_20005 [Myxococcales bacterium]|nr:hypothetical protein [Myxococcales bacterium]